MKQKLEAKGLVSYPSTPRSPYSVNLSLVPILSLIKKDLATGSEGLSEKGMAIILWVIGLPVLFYAIYLDKSRRARSEDAQSVDVKEDGHR
jgi:hypothetical protein